MRATQIERHATCGPPKPPLGVGDSAPPLAIEEFLWGAPFAVFAPGRVYLVEFWAIWCGPCVASIPHLTELQRKRPEITVLGVVERLPDVAEVKAFVARKDEEIGYAVALQAPSREGGDRDRGQMSRDWLEPSCSIGVPTAFIIDAGGRIAWIGHPLQAEKPLVELLEGRFDLAAAIEANASRAERRRLQGLFLEALQKRDEDADPASSFKEFDELARQHPEMARELEHAKLFHLKEKQAILVCARALLLKARGDPYRLLLIGVSLLNAHVGQDEEARLTGASNADIAVLGVAALTEAEPLLRAEEQSSHSDEKSQRIFWFQFHETLARGLAGGGRAAEARARAQEALSLGREAKLNPAILARLESWLAQDPR